MAAAAAIVGAGAYFALVRTEQTKALSGDSQQAMLDEKLKPAEGKPVPKTDIRA